MNLWDFKDDGAKVRDLDESLVEVMAMIKKMPPNDTRLILEISTANLATSMGIISRMDTLMNVLRGIEDGESSAQT